MSGIPHSECIDFVQSVSRLDDRQLALVLQSPDLIYIDFIMASGYEQDASGFT